MMPVAWTRTYSGSGKPARVFATTMGASQDLLSDGLRRLPRQRLLLDRRP